MHPSVTNDHPFEVSIRVTYGGQHLRSTTAQDFVGVMSGVTLAFPSYYILIKVSI